MKVLGPEISLRWICGAPVTVAVVALSVLTSCAVWLRSLSVERLVTDIRFLIEPWRLVTSSLAHVDPVHLIANAWWLFYLGRPLEARLGHFRFLGALTLFAVGSAVSQHALFRGGIGLSGVVYGVFCLLWVLARREQDLRRVVNARNTTLMVCWFFFCILTTLTKVWVVGNAAHLVGAALGLLWGAAMTGMRLRLAVSAMIGLVVLSLLAAMSPIRRCVNLSSDAAAAATYSGWLALGEHRYAEALLLYADARELDDTQAASWYGAGAAEQAAGFVDEAIEDYRRAVALAPGEPAYRQALESLEAWRAAGRGK